MSRIVSSSASGHFSPKENRRRPGPFLRQKIEAARKKEAQLQRKRQCAHEQNDHRGVCALTNKLLTMPEPKLLAVVDCLPRFSKADGPSSWRSDDEVFEIAKNLSAAKAPRDHIKMWALRKDTPGRHFRVIARFGLRDSARQLLVKRAIEPLLKANDVQFGQKGRGRDEAIRHMRALIDERGFEWGSVIDLKSFFPSIDQEWLINELKRIVGKEVTKSTILIGDERAIKAIVHDRLYHSHMDAKEVVNQGRSGLPQGSRTSSAVATHVVASVLEQVQLSDEVSLVAYVDEFAILGRTEREVVQAFETLRDAFARHPAGKFTFDGDGASRISDGIQFLGYEISKTELERCVVSLPKDKLLCLEDRVFIVLNDIDEGRRDIEFLYKWLSSFISAHGQADSEFLERIVDSLSLALGMDVHSDEEERAFQGALDLVEQSLLTRPRST